MTEIEILKRRLERERQARKQAETILEQKALELYHTNEELLRVNESLEQKVTERTKELKRSEERYRQIIETATDLIYRMSPDGVITYVNPIGKYKLGFEQKEAIGQLYAEFIHPDYLEEVTDYYTKIKDDRQFDNYYEFPVLSKAGKAIWLGQSIQLITNNEGKILEIAAVARDITERKIAEDRLRYSEEKYRGIIENMELGLMEVDLEQTIVRAYKLFCEMTGYTEEELIGQNAAEIFLPADFEEVMDAQQKRRGEGQTGVYEIQIRKKDGSQIWVLISGAPIFNQDGEVTGSIGIHYDITARKKLENDLKVAKEVAEHAQEAEKQFLARMSHEIRTPLNAIIGMSHILYDTNPTEEQREYLSILKSSSDILQALISDILDFSKIEVGEILVHEKDFDLVGLVKSIQKTFQLKLEDQPINVGIEVDDRIQNLLFGDDLLLNQVLLNLMGNAAKFTTSGEIGVKVKVIEENPAKKSFTLQFEVYDTGIGISPENQRLIFQKFKQAGSEVRHKFGGTGLGLAIVKQIIELQNGEIHVESELNKGTSFIFTIEYRDTGIKIGETTEHLPLVIDANISCHRILVAEDNYMNRKYISTLFQKWDIPYTFAHNGKEAVEWANRERFDLIFMDISMPEMNGYEATIAIRNTANLNQHTPIVALTASALISKKDKAMEIGMTDYLPKPFKPLTLLNLIKEYAEVKNRPHSEESPQQELEAIIDLSETSEDFAFNSVLNREYLAYFYDGDLEYAADMFETFLTYSVKELEGLRPLIEAGKWEDARKLAHKLKPTFSMVGLTELEKRMLTIEQITSKNPNRSEVLEKLDEVESELNKFVPVLKNDLAKMQKVIS